MKINTKMNRKPHPVRGYGIRTKLQAGACYLAELAEPQKSFVSSLMAQGGECSVGKDGLIGCCVTPKLN